MYIEASLMRPGHTARLLSSWLRGSHAPQCLVFHYHMYGSGTGILSVLLRRSGREKDALLWRRRGEQSVSWMRATVDYDCDSKHQGCTEVHTRRTRRHASLTHSHTHTHTH